MDRTDIGKEMGMPFVSVIIPIYNVERYLSQCLDSVIKQTYRNMEIICIDDKSTDGSLGILEEYSALDSRIIILQNDMNRGLAYSRNAGIDRSRGEYLLFVDSDDYIRENLVETALAKAEGNDLVCFDYLEENALDGLEVTHSYHMADGLYGGSEYFVRAVGSQSIIYASWSRLYARRLLEENRIRFYNGILYEDILFCFLCLLAAKRVVSVHRQMYVYRIRCDSIMQRQITCKSLESYFISICEMTGYYLNREFGKGSSDAIESYIRSVCREFLRACRKCEERQPQAGDPIEAADTYLKLFNIFSGLFGGTGLADKVGIRLLERIRTSENILIYGAGDIARDVLETLDRYDVPVLGLAVTSAKGNRRSVMGVRVRELTEYRELRDKCLVLIATAQPHYPGIRNELERHGFQDYMEVLT